jgi:PPOX class probable FMN-dependent enzyme
MITGNDMTLAPWRSPLARALHRNRALVYSRYAQLATISPEGRPTNRTIVFRGFMAETNQLWFVTDRRSEKIDHILHNPWGELCWYFPKTREQFRISGSLQLVMVDEKESTWLEERKRAWSQLSDAARTQFSWPHPKQERENLDVLEAYSPDPLQPLDTFCLLVLHPTQVDHLELRGHPQDRTLYQWGDDQVWRMQSVNP